MIYGFDFDGTIVKSFTSSPLPGVRELLHSLPPTARTFIATNQAGPVYRAVSGDMKYPTVEDVARNMTDAFAALDWRPQLLLIATYAGRDGEAWLLASERTAVQLLHALRPCLPEPMRNWRKPGPGMLAYAIGHFVTRPRFVTYIGDMRTDEEAADAAGVRFVQAEDWRSGAVVLQ